MKKNIKLNLLLATGALGLASICASIVSTSQVSQSKNKDPLTVQYTTVKYDRKAEGQDDVEFVGPLSVKAKVGRQFATVAQPIATLDGYVFTYWETYDSETGKYHEFTNTSLIPAEGVTLYPHFDIDVELQTCVGLQAIRDSNVSMITHGDPNLAPSVYYSKDGIVWTKYRENLIISLKSGEVLYFKGDNGDKGFNTDEINYTSFSISGAVSLNGNAMTLLDNGKINKDHPEEEPIPNNYCFYKLFEDCSGIVSISTNFLPSIHLKDYCYAYMFYNCRCLTDFPSSLLPDTQLDDGDSTYEGKSCYRGMFMNCSGLKTIPKGLLPAGKTTANPNGTLSTSCYYSMFEGCSGLESLPYQFLPAQELTTACYCAMFEGCKKLGLGEIHTDLLPAKILAPYCYANMFSVCESLVDISTLKLPATTLASNCYNQMFYGCIKLTNAPTLSPSSGTATLADSCYSGMFYNCHKLVAAPALSATTLQPHCYEFMFCNCYDITAMPSLPATVLPEYCYHQMFKNCTSLSSTNIPALNATTWGAHCYEEMFSGCTALATTPTFPQVAGSQFTLEEGCCMSMFAGCSNLATASILQATTPAKNCYKSMFSGCEKLTSAGLRLTTTAEECCVFMFVGCHLLYTYTTDQGDNKLIWATPSVAAGYSASNVRGMFQDTAQHLTYGFEPAAGQSYWHG